MKLPEEITDYIDGKDDAGRDRIIEAQLWKDKKFFYDGEPSCLLSHGEGWASPVCQAFRVFDRFEADYEELDSVFWAFDTLCNRHGSASVIRAIKAYAAQGHEIDVSRRAEAVVCVSSHTH